MPKKLPIEALVGEDAHFRPIQKLQIDFVPTKCIVRSVQSSIVKSDFLRLKKYIIDRAQNKCQCCESSQDLELHQRWEYCFFKALQTLKKIICICKKCHFATHMGKAFLIGMEDEAKQHMMVVRKWQNSQYQQHRQEAYKQLELRNKFNWILNLELLTDNGIKLRKKVREAIKNQPSVQEFQF